MRNNDKITLTYRMKRIDSTPKARWRWDVWTWKGAPGRPNAHLVHVTSDFGYTRTFIGAALAAARIARTTPHD